MTMNRGLSQNIPPKGSVDHATTQMPSAPLQIDVNGLTRRTLTNGMLGVLLLHTIMPMGAVAGDRGQEITEPMALDLLRRIREVALHDDLADRAFIETTLNGVFSPGREGGPNSEQEKKLFVRWQEFFFSSPGDPLLSQGKSHWYTTTTPVQGGRAEGRLHIQFDATGARGRGITESDMKAVFGPNNNATPTHSSSAFESGGGRSYRSYRYVFDGINKVWVAFSFDTRTKSASGITLGQPANPRIQKQNMTLPSDIGRIRNIEERK